MMWQESDPDIWKGGEDTPEEWELIEFSHDFLCSCMACIEGRGNDVGYYDKEPTSLEFFTKRVSNA